MTRPQSSNLRELAEHYLGSGYLAGKDDAQLLSAVGRVLNVHLAQRGSAIVVVAHPTPGQAATALKFPVNHARLEDTARTVLSQANLQPPRLQVGYGTLPRTNRACVRLAGNYAALSQLREQLNMALDHFDFEFEPFTYHRTDGAGTTGLLIQFLPDSSLPPAPEAPAQPGDAA